LKRFNEPPNQQYTPPPLRYNPSPAPPAFNNQSVARSYLPPPIPSSNPASPSSLQTSFHHPLAVQDISLDPPQRSFVAIERPLSAASNERPTSVASFSNISTHSNEPLNPTAQTNTKTSKKLGPRKSKKDQKNYQYQAMQSGRSLTPQPWHPDYSRSSSPNPLDLPEHQAKGSQGPGLEDIDADDRDERKGLHKTRKNIFSRLRRSRTKRSIKYEGRGKLAQFSNERLYLHWIRFGILQAYIAVLLLTYGVGLAAYIGVSALVLAMITLIYGTTLYHLRHIYMITKRDDILYYTRLTPSLLAIGLLCIYGANFVLTFTREATPSPVPWTDFHFG
jgi:hypothetical protein